MQNAPAYSDLAEMAGISRSYACEIVTGARRPSRSLAIHIFRKTGWKASPIAALSDDDIDALERIEGIAA